MAGQSSQSGHSPIPHRCNFSLVQHMVAGSYLLIPEGYLSSINLVRGRWTRRFQKLVTSKIAFPPAPNPIVVTAGIKPSSNIGSALVSAVYGRSSELGLYLWGN